MLQNIFLTTLLSFVCVLSFADSGELDRDRVNQSIQGTVVFRVDQVTGKMAMVHVNNVVNSEAEARALVNAHFTMVPKNKVRSELDSEAGASSWYWYYPGYGYGGGYGYGFNPYYYYYGHYYNPWYSYYYGYYSYYYFNRFSYYW